MTRAPGPCELPVGTKRRDYEICSVLGGGQTSLVYQAYDTMLNRYVAVKEYLPVAFAVRDDRLQLTVLPGKQEAFESGLRRFVAEARIMTAFDHCALRRSYQFFQEAGSAYIVMPYYPGKTLRAAVYEGWRIGNISDLFMITLPLLEGLSTIHQANYCHCGVSPDNILIQNNSEPILLDFGAIQRPGEFFGERPVSALAPGFAALEQYGIDRNVCIGAWTDVYAISAVIYHAVTGIVPEPATARVVRDTLRPLAGFTVADLPVRLLEAIDQGLSVAPQVRFASIEAFANALDQSVQAAMATPNRPTGAAVSDILSVAATVSSYSPRIRRLLQLTSALRDRIRQRGAG
ncbi:MAG: serine/threonine protein kinase [Azoarcus sp.]|nr:serine/threonine protein kinase [Azoarcus sp.]